MTVEDYTKFRLNQVVRRWTYRKADGSEGVGESRIAKCPKCGKKGEKTSMEVNNKRVRGRRVATYTHSADNLGFCTAVRENCEVVEVEGEWTPPAEGVAS